MKVACIQLNSGADVSANLEIAGEKIRQAAAKGAVLVATPENTGRMLPPKADKIGSAFEEADHPGIAYFSDLAEALKVWLLIGSLAVKVSDTKLANRSFLFRPDGRVKARYDKIHLYDVDLPDGESHRESRIIEPGHKAVLADCDGFALGMSVCYDLRFPHLYRHLAKAGAQILSVPSAFTVPTGKAHWHVLLRARAIETGCFILAPAQSGDHQGARKTYGHSLIINPWGEILADAGTDTGVISADINLEEVARARQAIPSLQHDRDFS